MAGAGNRIIRHSRPDLRGKACTGSGDSARDLLKRRPSYLIYNIQCDRLSALLARLPASLRRLVSIRRFKLIPACHAPAALPDSNARHFCTELLEDPPLGTANSQTNISCTFQDRQPSVCLSLTDVCHAHALPAANIQCPPFDAPIPTEATGPPSRTLLQAPIAYFTHQMVSVPDPAPSSSRHASSGGSQKAMEKTQKPILYKPSPDHASS